MIGVYCSITICWSLVIGSTGDPFPFSRSRARMNLPAPIPCALQISSLILGSHHDAAFDVGGRTNFLFDLMQELNHT
ncbi:hypothetical protein BDV30DRAFT_7883 [Aspergillus minisclerotigenes]|uniref:Uncharacterized protein n=1 Tax=Aspergillus minisclerotigenes TaxID=656917 RepID=A0A5N6JG15_9EURO|nr:hypothetical protein BDV30DRAFT_7883 [Aspergillus minisclerotigenes]